MDNLTPDHARIIRDFFLASIEAEHNLTRALINTIPANKLDFCASPGESTVAERAWNLVEFEHHALTGICDGQFGPAPAGPEESGVDALLAWDEARFAADLRRLKDLSGADLVRPVDAYGFVQPAIAFLTVYQNALLQRRGHLIGVLQMCGAIPNRPDSEVAGAESAAGELSEKELAAVVGGDDSSNTVMVSGANYATVTVVPSTSGIQNIPQTPTVGFGFGAPISWSSGNNGAYVGALCGALGYGSFGGGAAGAISCFLLDVMLPFL